jgi:hypothetical protein
LEFSEDGFFESELVNDWVRFLVGLLVFKQVVDEASQFTRCSRRRPRRSKLTLFTPVLGAYRIELPGFHYDELDFVNAAQGAPDNTCI